VLKSSGLVLLGGALGAWLRYILVRCTQTLVVSFLPVSSIAGTCFVNTLGCLLLGMLAGFLELKYGLLEKAPADLKLFLMTGFLGAFTTFSAYELEMLQLAKQGYWLSAAGYGVFSIIVGMLAFLLGSKLIQYSLT
jgi:fluoride exporter